MKNGKSLVELATELERQKHNRKDFIANSSALRLLSDEQDGSLMEIGSDVRLPVTSLCHEQIADRLDIPRKYYQRLQSSNANLFDANINHWLRKEPKDYLVRTLDDKSRAFLSNRYRPLDHSELAEVALPALLKSGADVKSCEITERRMYLKAVTPAITAEVSPGDVVQAGVVISNSETGHGALSVQPLIYRLVCSNGMIAQDSSLRRNHIGAKLVAGDAWQELLSEQTLSLNDRAFWSTVQDVIANIFINKDGFHKLVDRLRAAKSEEIKGEPIQVVELGAKKLGLNQQEQSSVLQHLLREGDLTKWGFANAITRTAQDVESYDRSTELESLGGQVIELNRSDWQTISTAGC